MSLAQTAPALTGPGPPHLTPTVASPRRPAMRMFTLTSSPSSPSQMSRPGSYSVSRVQAWVLACPLLPRNLGSLASFRSRCALQKPCCPSQHQTLFPSWECRAGAVSAPRPPLWSPQELASPLASVLQPWGCPPGLPGQHPGQDHSVRHRRFLPEGAAEPGAG